MIYIDNSGAISLALRHHDHTKHIDVRHHLIREAIEEGRIELQYIKTEDNTADLLTKPLPQPRHEKHMEGMGVHAIRYSG